MKKLITLIFFSSCLPLYGLKKPTIKSPIYKLVDGTWNPMELTPEQDAAKRSLGSLQLNSNIKGITLSEPGNYILASNLTSLTAPITISGSNVNLDLNGFHVSNSAGVCIDVGSSGAINNVVIKNGVVKGGLTSGVFITSSTNITVHDIQSVGNTVAGFELVNCSECCLKNCNAIDNGGASDSFGITTTGGTNNTFDSCTVKGTNTTSATFADQATGIHVGSTETKSIIRNCMVSDTMASNIKAIPYGIRLEPVDPTLDDTGLPTIEEAGGISSGAWSPDGRFFVTGEEANNIELFELRDNNLVLLDRYAHNSDANHVEWSPDGRYIVFGSAVSASGEFAVLEFKNEASLLKLSGEYEHPASVNEVVWAPNGRYIAMGGNVSGGIEVNVCLVTDTGVTPNGSSRANFAHGASVQSVDWSPNSRYLAIGASPSGGFNVQVLDFEGDGAGANTLTSVATIAGAGTVARVRWSPNGQYLAVGDATSGVAVYNFDGSSLTSVATGGSTAVQGLEWTQDGRYIFAGGGTTAEAFRFDETTLTSLATQTTAVAIRDVSISTDGSLFSVTTLNSGGGVEMITYAGLTYATDCVIDRNQVSNTLGAATGEAGANNGFGIEASTATNQVTNNSCFKNDVNYAFSINVFEQFIANLRASTPLPFANFSYPTP